MMVSKNMPITHVADCPHCLANKIGMTFVAASRSSPHLVTAIFACNGCRDITCVRIYEGNNDSAPLFKETGTLEEVVGYYNLAVVNSYPEREQHTAPHFTSKTVERTYLQGIDNARRKQNDAAAAMFRKALDVATCELDENLQKLSLASRINALFDAGRLTEDLKDWAHAIRLDGNKGAHGATELTDEEIAQLESFTELFLIYTFTLPAQVASKKMASEGAK